MQPYAVVVCSKCRTEYNATREVCPGMVAKGVACGKPTPQIVDYVEYTTEDGVVVREAITNDQLAAAGIGQDELAEFGEWLTEKRQRDAAEAGEAEEEPIEQREYEDGLEDAELDDEADEE